MLRNMISALLQEKLQLKEFVLHQNQSILPRVHSLQNVLIIQLFQKRVQAIQTVQVHLEAIVRLEVQVVQAPASSKSSSSRTDSGSSRTSKSSLGSSSSKGSGKTVGK